MYKRTDSLGDIHEKTIKLLDNQKKIDEYIKYRKEFDDASNFKEIQKYPIHIDKIDALKKSKSVGELKF